MDVFAGGQCVFQTAQYDRPAALGADVPLTGGVEGTAAAVGGQCRQTCRAQLRNGGQQRVHATRDREVAFTGLKALDGKVHGREG